MNETKEAEYEAFVLAKRPILLSLANRHLNRLRKQEREDIVQRALMVTWEKRDQIETNFFSFAYGALQLLCRSANSGLAGYRFSSISLGSSDIDSFNVRDSVASGPVGYAAVLGAELIKYVDEKDREEWKHSFETGCGKFSDPSDGSKKDRLYRSRKVLREIMR